MGVPASPMSSTPPSRPNSAPRATGSADPDFTSTALPTTIVFLTGFGALTATASDTSPPPSPPWSDTLTTYSPVNGASSIETLCFIDGAGWTKPCENSPPSTCDTHGRTTEPFGAVAVSVATAPAGSEIVNFAGCADTAPPNESFFGTAHDTWIW